MPSLYDPVRAHEYYLRTRKLKGRKKGQAKTVSPSNLGVGKTRVGSAARRRKAAERARVDKQVNDLRTRLAKLNAELKKRLAEQRETKREAEKPDTAAEKSKDAKRSKEWRAKNQQEIKNKRTREASKERSSSSDKKESSKKGGGDSVEHLKATISKVRDQLTAAVARQRALR